MIFEMIYDSEQCVILKPLRAEDTWDYYEILVRTKPPVSRQLMYVCCDGGNENAIAIANAK